MLQVTVTESTHYMSIKKRRPTLQDVADQVGVTKMTVSRFLRNPEKVSSKIKGQIESALDQLGYVHNRAPDILSKSRSYSIGVLVPSLTNQVFADVIKGIETETEPAGYQLMLAHYGYSQQSEEANIATLLSYNVDGLILSESYHTDRVKKMIETTGTPVVEIMDSISPAIQFSVGFDNEKASAAMTGHMIKLGRKNIVYLAARMDERTQMKMKGYEQTMNSHGLVPKSLQTEQPSSFSLGASLLKDALLKWPEVDGLFCTNDDLAIGALFECQRLGISVPDQIGIAGFHGHDFAKVTVPRLATVSTPRYEMGAQAASLLLNHLAGNKVSTKAVELEFEIFAGESI